MISLGENVPITREPQPLSTPCINTMQMTYIKLVTIVWRLFAIKFLLWPTKSKKFFCRIKDKFARSVSYCFSCFVFECEQDSNTWHINDRVLVIVANLNIHLILCTITLTNYPNRTHTMKHNLIFSYLCRLAPYSATIQY